MRIRLRQRSVVVLAIICAVFSVALSGSASAQVRPKMSKQADRPEDLLRERWSKEVDRQYQSTLKSIPDQPQKKADPWSNIRSSTPAPK